MIRIALIKIYQIKKKLKLLKKFIWKNYKGGWNGYKLNKKDESDDE